MYKTSLVKFQTISLHPIFHINTEILTAQPKNNHAVIGLLAFCTEQLKDFK